MRLAVWLRQNHLTNLEFARRLGVSHTTVGRWISGETFPHPDTLRHIAAITEGDVTYSDFFSELT